MEAGPWGEDSGELFGPQKEAGLTGRLGPSSQLLPLLRASLKAMGVGGRGEEEDLVTFQVG